MAAKVIVASQFQNPANHAIPTKPPASQGNAPSMNQGGSNTHITIPQHKLVETAASDIDVGSRQVCELANARVSLRYLRVDALPPDHAPPEIRVR